MTSFKDRLLQLFPDYSIAKIAESIEMSHMGLTKVFRNNTIPKADTLLNIHNKTGCDFKWLITGEGQPFPTENTVVSNSHSDTPIIEDTLGNKVDLDDFVFLPRYDVYASAGHGYGVDGEENLYPLAFRRDWLLYHIGGQFDKLSVIVVKGDSMEGVLNDADTILVNHADTTPRDGIYVLRIDNEIYVKRINHQPGKLIVSSANKEYSSFEINLHDDSINFAVIGKVVWLGRAL